MSDNTSGAPTASAWETALGMDAGSGSASQGSTPPSSEGGVDDGLPKNEIVESLMSDDGDSNPAGSSKKTTEKANSASTKGKIPEAKETIVVTDESGKRRKVEIDYSNREAVKKAYEQAAGMRKFQAERDQALQARKALEAEKAELQKNWGLLENAYQQGEEALIDLLRGKKGAYKEHVQKQIDRAKFLERASPEEVEALNTKERIEQMQRDLQKTRDENLQFQKSMAEQKEAVETKELQNRIHPAFDKYRFAGKLGDQVDEHMFDEMLWTNALKRLEPYEEQGLLLTPEVVEKEFRDVAMSLRRRINVQADKKVSKVMDQKKQEATENVQSKVKASYGRTEESENLRKLIKSGDTNSIFGANWNTFRKYLTK